MVKVNDSVCICGACKTRFDFSWEIVDINTKERPQGEESEYYAEGTAVCPQCGNAVQAELVFWEYPVGHLNACNVLSIQNNCTCAETVLNEPDIYFIDL